jgi:hypothetical protein
LLTRPVKTQASRWASVRYRARLPDWGNVPTEGAVYPAKISAALPQSVMTRLPDPSKLKLPAGPRSGTAQGCQTVGKEPMEGGSKNETTAWLSRLAKKKKPISRAVKVTLVNQAGRGEQYLFGLHFVTNYIFCSHAHFSQHNLFACSSASFNKNHTNKQNNSISFVHCFDTVTWISKF